MTCLQIYSMRFTLAPFATLVLAALHVASATPLVADLTPFPDATCGQPCVQQSDCTGTCSFCSTPAEYRWQCLEP
ncbi:hypothetical protein F4781DRAFT_184031 [Annulohypoxylon bovei var. microspora]|nr:hypothetical protein F4781DRAFT_184031 [Annulohypoxylon bovei var. microspora]